MVKKKYTQKEVSNITNDIVNDYKRDIWKLKEQLINWKSATFCFILISVVFYILLYCLSHGILKATPNYHIYKNECYNEYLSPYDIHLVVDYNTSQIKRVDITKEVCNKTEVQEIDYNTGNLSCQLNLQGCSFTMENGAFESSNCPSYINQTFYQRYLFGVIPDPNGVNKIDMNGKLEVTYFSDELGNYYSYFANNIVLVQCSNQTQTILKSDITQDWLESHCDVHWRTDSPQTEPYLYTCQNYEVTQ